MVRGAAATSSTVRGRMEGDAELFASLLERARGGDQGAIADLYRRHHGRLLRVLRVEVGDAAEDVASQTWLEVFGGLGRFQGDETGFRSLLFTIARRRTAGAMCRSVPTCARSPPWATRAPGC